MNVAAALEHAPDWHAERAKGIGGSDAKKIMDGDWLPLWQEKTGRAESEDLSRVLPVQLGTWTEPFNRHWFEQETGITVSTKNCESLFHPEHAFMLGNLDGWAHGEGGVSIFEAKHTSAFAKDEEIVSRYFPQIQHYLAVVGAGHCYLSVIFGNHKWAYFEIQADADYQAELIEREAEFWGHVTRDEPPLQDIESKAVAIALDDMREVSMDGNNAWASSAADWLENHKAVKVFKGAEKVIKEMVAADVKLAHGHGVKVSRSKAGALTIREQK